MRKPKDFRDALKEPNSENTELDKEMDPTTDLKEGGMYGYLDWFYDGDIPGEDE
jgi:hypothetical protein